MTHAILIAYNQAMIPVPSRATKSVQRPWSITTRTKLSHPGGRLRAIESIAERYALPLGRSLPFLLPRLMLEGNISVLHQCEFVESERLVACGVSWLCFYSPTISMIMSWMLSAVSVAVGRRTCVAPRQNRAKIVVT